MKRLTVIIMAFAFNMNLMADCSNAYQIKANKRAKTNRTLKKATTMVVGGGATAALVAVTVASGGAAMVAGAPIALIVGTGFTDEIFSSVSATRNNNYYKALKVIQAAEKGAVPQILLEKLDKKMSYYSYSDYEQQEMNKEIVKIIKEANESKKLCTKNGKIKPMNFNKLARYVRDELRETL